MLNYAKWQLYLHCLTGYWAGWLASTASINFRHPSFSFSSQSVYYQSISGFIVTLNTSYFKRSRSLSPFSFLFILPSDLSFYSPSLILFSFASVYFSLIFWLQQFYCHLIIQTDEWVMGPWQLASCWWLAAVETSTTPRFALKTQEKPRTFRKINRESKKTNKWTKENYRN
jgi:hypothetical protein